jgi:hypothetical protein
MPANALDSSEQCHSTAIQDAGHSTHAFLRSASNQCKEPKEQGLEDNPRLPDSSAALNDWWWQLPW